MTASATPSPKLPIIASLSRGGEAMGRAWRPALFYFVLLSAWSEPFSLDIMPTTDFSGVTTEGLGAMVLPYLFYLAVTGWLACGMFRVAIDAVRSRELDWTRLATPASILSQVAVFSLLGLVAVCFGLLPFVFPGLILMLMLSQANFSLLDEGTTWLQALRHSYELTLGHTSRIAILGSVYFVASSVGGMLIVAVTLALSADGASFSAAGDILAPGGQMSDTAKNVLSAQSALGSLLYVYGIFVSAAVYEELLQMHGATVGEMG